LLRTPIMDEYWPTLVAGSTTTLVLISQIFDSLKNWTAYPAFIDLGFSAFFNRVASDATRCLLAEENGMRNTTRQNTNYTVIHIYSTLII
jgi:hypothetical protein